MPTFQTPVNCGSITLATTGVVVPASAKVACTADELTDITLEYKRPKVVSSDLATGDVIVSMSEQITSITMNGNVYAVTNGISAAMDAVDATELIYESFKLVVG